MESDYLTQVFSPEAFKGRVYGVTGGAHGIGESTVRALTSLGASVLVIDINAEFVSYIERDLRKEGHAVEAVAADVTDAAAVAAAIERTVGRFGRLDGWVNNAMLSPRNPIERQDESFFVRAWEVNTLAPWRMAKLCLPHFRKNGGGSIVNISSIMAHLTRAGCAAYTSSKSGLEGLTRALAVELAPDRVRVNSMAPGTIASYSGIPNDPEVQNDYHRRAMQLEDGIGEFAQPLPFPGRGMEAAGPILFFLSDAARFVTGTLLLSDGGAGVELASGAARHPEAYAKIIGMRDELRSLKEQYRKK
jgi:NAD(P)-dependent dehydrogenase (short-subunit alcohol dehydrogenase family)